MKSEAVVGLALGRVLVCDQLTADHAERIDISLLIVLVALKKVALVGTVEVQDFCSSLKIRNTKSATDNQPPSP